MHSIEQQKPAPRDSSEPFPLFCPHWANRIHNFLNVVALSPVKVYRIWSRSVAVCGVIPSKFLLRNSYMQVYLERPLAPIFNDLKGYTVIRR